MFRKIVLCPLALLLILLMNCHSISGGEPDKIKVSEDTISLLNPEDIAFIYLLKGKEIQQISRHMLEVLDGDTKKEYLEARKESSKMAEENFSKCQQILERYLKEQPESNHQWIYWSLGMCLWGKDNFKLAVVYFNKGLEYDYSRLLCLRALYGVTIWGEILPKEEFFNRIVSYRRQIVSLLPYSAGALVALRELEREKSNEHLQKIKRNPGPPDSRLSIEDFIDDFISEEEKKNLKRYDELKGIAERYGKRAEILFKSGEKDVGASDVLKESIKYRIFATEQGGTSRCSLDDAPQKYLKDSEEGPGVGNTIVGDYYVRYAEMFQKEIEKGYYSDVYAAIIKEVKNKAEFKKKVNAHIIDSYKRAIFYYWQACFDNYYFVERNSRKVADLRQKINELESQPNQPKPEESKPK